MNYRHHFHAGNFADVVKHVLLVQLVRDLQKKEKGFLYLDTHAGRGRYDLAREAQGDTLARKPEWPEGVGRVWNREQLPPAVTGYRDLVGSLDGGTLEPPASGPRFYPGSPMLMRALRRPQDRIVACEKHPDECEALRLEFGPAAGVSVQETDGYVALRALLPPPERRGLVLVDPPFEAQDEFAQLADAVGEGLARFRTGVFAIWYPLTGRARVDDFFGRLIELRPPPTLACEVEIAGPGSPLRMKGCGVLVINPPWQFDAMAGPTLKFLANALAQDSNPASTVRWVVAPN